MNDTMNNIIHGSIHALVTYIILSLSNVNPISFEFWTIAACVFILSANSMLHMHNLIEGE